MMISDILRTGAENATTGRTICERLNINARDLTQAIEQERRAGSPICASTDSTNPGYYLAASAEEMQRYCDSLNHRAGEIHKTRQACLRTISTLPGAEAAQ